MPDTLKPDELVDDLAAVLWRTEATDAGVPQSVIDGRTRQAFDDESQSTKYRWRKFARAALSTRATTAEAALVKARAALEYAHKGLDMVHNGLMDPTRPRQAVGEVCFHFLDAARLALSDGEEDNGR